jgi:hypothetical protein
VSPGWRKAEPQFASVQSAPEPSQPPKYPKPEATEKACLRVTAASTFFLVLSKVFNSRSNQGDVRARPTSGRGRVHERGLDERTSLAIESTATSLEVRNGTGKRPVAGKVSAGGEDASTLNESGLYSYMYVRVVFILDKPAGAYCTATTVVGEVDGMALSHSAGNSDSKENNDGLEGKHL